MSEDATNDSGRAGSPLPAESEKPKWPKKPPKTEADLAAIAYLDKLRAGGGDPPPRDVPLACIVKVTEYENVPKANEAYAMVRVVGADGKTWRLCVHRGTVKVGKNALFISDAAALPVEDRFRNPAVCTVKEKVYKYGFGVKVRRLLPHVKRHIYPLNCGVLFPTSDFVELGGSAAHRPRRGTQNPPAGSARMGALLPTRIIKER